jgi:small subunit ribosomal protein S9
MSSKSNSYYNSIGRRKNATARVKLTNGKGIILINDQPADQYFENSKYLIRKLSEPFGVLDIENKFDIAVIVKGGGLNGQVDAIKLAISKCLIELNPDFKTTLKRANLLKRDSREKERKKFGLLGARKKRQFTKR